MKSTQPTKSKNENARQLIKNCMVLFVLMTISVLDGIGQLIILVLLKQSKKLKGRKPKSE